MNKKYGVYLFDECIITFTDEHQAHQAAQQAGKYLGIIHDVKVII